MNKTERYTSQPAVKIDRGINDTLSEWLKTDYAKGLGFHSKASFITQATRELLMKYKGPHFVDIKKHPTHYILHDYQSTEEIEIAINMNESALECLKCESFGCNHIFFVWSNPQEETMLRNLKFLNPIIHLTS